MQSEVERKLSNTCELASGLTGSEDCPTEFRPSMQGQTMFIPVLPSFMAVEAEAA